MLLPPDPPRLIHPIPTAPLLSPILPTPDPGAAAVFPSFCPIAKNCQTATISSRLGAMLQNGLSIDTSHNYNLHSPDATFSLASVEGQVHRLVVWKANGAKDRLRISETLQRPGEPTFPTGVIRYLRISQDVVFPIYAVAENRAREWIIEVRYDSGGESVLYSFRDKVQALGFQSLVTGYDAVDCYENTAIQLTLRRHENSIRNALRARANPQLKAWGEVQLWKRKPPTTETSPQQPIGSPVTLTSSGTGTHTQGQQRLSDNLSLCTDTTTGQQFYLASTVPKPVLVMFFKNWEGGYTMMRTDIPTLRSTMMNTSLILQPKGGPTMSIRQLQVTGANLAQWNVCAMGALSKAPAQKPLTATSLTLTPSQDKLTFLSEAILELCIDYGKAVVRKDIARRDVAIGEEPEGPQWVRRTSLSPGSSSSGDSAAGGHYGPPLLPRASFESLAGMIGRDRLSAEARASQPRRTSTIIAEELIELEPNVRVIRPAELDSRSSRTLSPTSPYR